MLDELLKERLKQSQSFLTCIREVRSNNEERDGATGRSASPYIEDSADDPKTAKSKVKSKGLVRVYYVLVFYI